MNRLLRFENLCIIVSSLLLIAHPYAEAKDSGSKEHPLRARAVASEIPANVLNLATASDDDNWDDRFDQLGISGATLAVAVSGTDVYAGGVFSMVGTLSANNIAKWDGSAWSTLGTGSSNGTNGTVLAVAVNGSDVIVGGNFTLAGGVTASNIAKWNGTNWVALGSGITGGDVRAIRIVGTDVYVSGVFTTAGGQSANNIAKWAGSSWSTLGSGINGPVYALAANGDDLFAGGSFSSAGGQSVSNIAKWSFASSDWSALGAGANLDVNALVVGGNMLYAGGLFATAGAVSAKKMAKWDGADWTALGTGFTGGDVSAITLIGSRLFAGGTFTTAGSVSASRVAKWDGTDWSALGSGITGGFVFGLSADLNTGLVFAGGSFDNAGGKTSNRFARWADPGGAVPVELTSFTVKPNGTNVELNWVTATEENNFGFDIERMSVTDPNGIWARIAFVNGHGTTVRERKYAYIDDVRSLIGNRGNVTLSYRIKQIDLDGTFEYFTAVEVQLGELPENILLAQNYPNPFNPVTTIEFVIPEDGFTTLTVYNLLGQDIETLVAEPLSAGVVYKINFNATQLPSGPYFYVVRSGDPANTVRKSMLLLK